MLPTVLAKLLPAEPVAQRTSFASVRQVVVPGVFSSTRT